MHDATAFGELSQTERLGFCAEGEGGPYAASGATALGGTRPVNTSGGLGTLCDSLEGKTFFFNDTARAERYTTTEIYDRVGVGDEVWAAVMPHDRAIYFVVAADGVLVGGDGAAADAAPASSQDSPKPPAT